MLHILIKKLLTTLLEYCISCHLFSFCQQQSTHPYNKKQTLTIKYNPSTLKYTPHNNIYAQQHNIYFASLKIIKLI